MAESHSHSGWRMGVQEIFLPLLIWVPWVPEGPVPKKVEPEKKTQGDEENGFLRSPNCVLLWLEMVVAPAFEVRYLFHVWHSELLLLPNFHRGKWYALMEIHLRMTWQSISLHLKDRVSSVAMIPQRLSPHWQIGSNSLECDLHKDRDIVLFIAVYLAV